MPKTCQNHRFSCSKLAERKSSEKYQKALLKVDQTSDNEYDECDEKEPVKPQEGYTGPGPGQYEVLKQSPKNMGWKSSFKSNADRSSYIQKNKTPGPGFYDVKLIKQAKSVIKEKYDFVSGKNNNTAGTSSPEKIERCLRDLQEGKKSPSHNKENVMSYQVDSNVPGPGSYYHEIPTFKPLY
jgi:hypothetical protein